MVTQQEIDEVIAAIEKVGMSSIKASDLRLQFPQRHFTLCTEDDINTESCVAEADAYKIYLVDSSGHCSKLTTNYDTASGYVIAENIED